MSCRTGMTNSRLYWQLVQQEILKFSSFILKHGCSVLTLFSQRKSCWRKLLRGQVLHAPLRHHGIELTQPSRLMKMKMRRKCSGAKNRMEAWQTKRRSTLVQAGMGQRTSSMWAEFWAWKKLKGESKRNKNKICIFWRKQQGMQGSKRMEFEF